MRENNFIKQISILDQKLNIEAAEGKYDPSTVVDTLINCGFTSCFYFDAGWDILANDKAIILTEYRTDKIIDDPLGKKIYYKNSAIKHIINSKKSNDVYSVSKEENELFSQESQQLAFDLKIENDLRIFLPILLQEELIAVVTCVWNCDEVKLKKKNKHSLLVLSSLLTKYINKANERKLKKNITELRSFLDDTKIDADDSLNFLLNKSIALIRNAIDASAASIFKYDWYSGKLDKINENIETKEHVLISIKEQYSIGQYLTGLAWVNGNRALNYIIDFPNYQKNKKQDIDLKSNEFHKKYIGGVKTILYYRLDCKHIKLMVRIFNKKDSDLPFLTSDELLLSKLADELSIIIDELIVLRRLSDLQHLTKTALSNITESSKAFKTAEGLMKHERVDVVGYLCFNKKDKHLSHYYCLPKYSNSYDNRPTTLSSEPILNSSDIDHYTYNINTRNPTEWEESLLNIGIKSLFVLNLMTDLKQGVLLIKSDRQNTHSYKNGEIPESHLKTLRSILTILQTSVESEESYVTSKAALRLVSMIGHEVLGPVQLLSQAANNIGESIYKEFLDVPNNLIDEKAFEQIENIIDAKNSLIDGLSNDVAVMMNMIKLLAENPDHDEGENELVLNVENMVNLNDILKDAVNEVNNSVFFYNKKGIKTPFRFVFNSSSERLHTIKGDRKYLRKAFVNIMTNAVKYSLPPGDNNPIEIDIRSIPQTNMNIIQIQNFGLSITKSEREDIFKAFYRGDNRDEKNTRRGLGIGLYFARRIFVAHKGEVFVNSSHRTFNDPHRNIHEGWITTMEVRLPTDTNLNIIGKSKDYLR